MYKIGFFIDLLDIHGLKWIRDVATQYECFIVTHDFYAHHNIEIFSNDGKIIPVYYILPQTYSVLKFTKMSSIRRQIRELIHHERPHIIHSMFIEPYSYYAHLSDVNHVITTRGSDILVLFQQKPSGFYNSIVRRFLDKKTKRILNKAVAITSTSFAQNSVIQTVIKNPQKAVVIPTGIDLTIFNAANAAKPVWDKKHNGFYFFCPRAWKENYNIHILIEAFQHLLQRKDLSQKPFLVLLNNYGIKEYEQQIYDSVKKMNESIVVLEQMNEPKKMVSAYLQSDAVIMIPESDGTPNTALEAMALHIPVMVGKAKYDPLFFNQETVWFINDYSPEHVADCMFQMMAEQSERIKSKTNAAYQAVTIHGNLRNSVCRMVEIYNNLLQTQKFSITQSDCNNHQQPVSCSKCLLTTEDEPGLKFNQNGECNHCVEHFHWQQSHTPEAKKEFLDTFLKKIKASGSPSGYDCIMGLSGGTDSSYLLMTLVDMGIRPLVVHFDNGWNTEFAVKNIEMLTSKLKVDLFTHVADWEEFRNIQIAFFKASVVDIELITDHAIIALLIQMAKKHNIQYIITGQNTSTETHLPSNWHHLKTDWLNIKSIYRKYGKGKIKHLPHLNFFDLVKKDKYGYPTFVNLLDYIDYNKEQAQKELMERVGWIKYEGKHFESVFTRFYQGYILPKKFGIDKRKAHLSSLICSGQITKEDAIIALQDNHYTSQMIHEDKIYVTKKLGITIEEFESYMNLPVKKHLDFPSYITHHYKYLQIINSILFGRRRKNA